MEFSTELDEKGLSDLSFSIKASIAKFTGLSDIWIQTIKNIVILINGQYKIELIKRSLS